MLDSEKVAKAMKTIRLEMVKDEPSKQGSYAHSWHCNIAMMVYDSIMSEAKFSSKELAHKIGNESATRFMKLCFEVDTKQ